MASKASDDSTHGSKDTQSTIKTRAKRGKVCLNSVYQRRGKGEIQEVDFNEDGQPVGEFSCQLQSYVGLLTREWVKISIKTWKEVPEAVKDTIWAQVKDEYIRENEQGKLDSDEGSSDLLSLALDKPQPAGCVRGKGAGIKPKTYFQTVRASTRATNQITCAELEAANKKIDEQASQIQVLDKVVHDLKSKMETFESKMGEHDKEYEGIGSCSMIKVATKETRDMESPGTICIGKSDFLHGKEVKLLLEVSKKLVAYGTVFVAGAVLHGSNMPTDCLRHYYKNA